MLESKLKALCGFLICTSQQKCIQRHHPPLAFVIDATPIYYLLISHFEHLDVTETQWLFSLFLYQVGGDWCVLTPSCCPAQPTAMALGWLRCLCSQWWHSSSPAGGCVTWESWQRGAKGSVLLCLHGLPQVISALAEPVLQPKPGLCVSVWQREVRGVLGTETPCRGAAERPACPVPSAQNSPCRCSPLTALCGWLLQLCCERYWSSGCFCSFPSIARSVQERGWGWNNLCLVELSHTLQAQPAGLVTPGENSCREYMHWATHPREPHRQIPDLEESWAAAGPRHNSV